MAEGLKIIIDADISGAMGAINQLNAALGGIAKTSVIVSGAFNGIDPKQFDELKNKVKSLEAEIVKLKQIISELNNGKPLDKFPPAADKATKGMKNVTDASKAGSAALTDVNRVIQDSAYGFNGIANNLTELPDKFRRLSAAAKESGQSVGKVFLSTLMGPAGIGTAISLITTALTFASIGFGAWTRGFTNSGKASKEAKNDLDNYGKSLEAVSQEVGQSAGRITTLVNALNSGTLNTGQRKKALDELKQQNQEFFGALKDEKGVIEGLQIAYDGYLQRIKSIATAKAIETQLTKLFDKKLQLELDLDPKFNAAISPENQRLIGQLQKELNKLGGPVDVQANNDVTKLNDNLKKRLELQTRINRAQSQNIVDLSGTRAQIEDIERRITGLSKLQQFTGNFGISAAAEAKQKKEKDTLKDQLEALEKIRDAQKELQGKMFDLSEIESATDKLSRLESIVGNLKLQIAVRDAKKAGLPAAEIEQLKDAIKLDTEKRLNEAFEKEAILLEGSPKLKFSQAIKVEIPNNINFFSTGAKTSNFNVNDVVSKATGFDKKIPEITIPQARIKLLGFELGTFLNDIDKINKELKDQIKQTFEGGFTDVFAELGEGFGEAIASADFGNGMRKAAQNILSIVGGVMQQLGKQLIAAAIKIKLLKETFEKWAIANPGLAILAGVGLVAAGAALKNIKFDGPKFAEGGIVSGPMIGQVGERFRPEVILPLDRLPQLFKQIGGDAAGGTQLIPIINNEGLYLAMKRGERSAGRRF